METVALGAESVIYRINQWGRALALKWRKSKPYLLEEIDSLLRRTRTARECKALTAARTLGIRTPAVYSLDLNECAFIMDFIDGIQLKQYAEENPLADVRPLCEEFGRALARLHLGGIVHGDPTTSNVIVDKKRRLWFVDFGLSEMNATVEMKGVDLHLVRRALETTHWNQQEEMLDAVLEGYRALSGKDAESVFTRMGEIRERGRYH
jgi:TP53 regulating kinase-like protein